jgi:hypothetical protein
MKLWYDSIEDTEEFQEIEETINHKVDNILSDNKEDAPFSPYKVWALKKQILLDEYNIIWKSPADLNPNIIFD